MQDTLEAAVLVVKRTSLICSILEGALRVRHSADGQG